ncbi:MAG TPA: ATP-binding protein [Candidatus Eremiobacteraceae bacterium]|nr:ATP-binding protein [Candidatus Eremiobacteraceae bacterium]
MTGLRLRLFLVIALVSVVTLGAVGAFSSRATTELLQNMDVAEPSMAGEAIRGQLQTYYASHGVADFSGELRSLGNEHHVGLVAISKSGALLGASSSALAHARITRQGDELQIASNSDAGGAAETRLIIRGAIGDIRDKSGAIVATIFALPQSDRGAASQLPALAAARARESIWTATAVGVFAALCAALVLSAQILRPIRALQAAAGRMESGDFGARVHLRGHDEIAALGQSFDSMAGNLARLEQLRKNLVSDIAHELRSPLTNIRAHIEALQDGRIAPDAASFESIAEESRLLERLVSDLQDLSLADAGALRLDLAALHVGPVVTAAVDAFRATLDRKALTVDRNVPDDAVVVADPYRLRQIVQNLLANAVNYASDGGRVEINANRVSGSIETVVFNSGSHVDDEELVAIFDRFHRIDRSRARSTGGAGLGLAIVKQLVEAHGGRVWACNAAAGFEVHFTLPAADHKGPPNSVGGP